MSYKFTFADNAFYTSTDVNNITKRLVTSGIEDCFTDGVPYNVSKFNELGRLMYTSGTVPGSFLSLKVVSSGDSEVFINPGTAFFDDGAVIEIEKGGETLTFTPGRKNYVYLKNDLAEKNTCYPICSTDEPTGMFVMLSEIDEDGTITDKRTFARGRIPGYESVAGKALFFDETVKATFTDEYTAVGHAEFDVGDNSFKYIIFTNLFKSSDESKNLSIYNIQNGSVASFYIGGNSMDKLFDESGKIHLYNDKHQPYEQHTATVSFENGILKIDVIAECMNGWGSNLGDVGDETDVKMEFVMI